MKKQSKTDWKRIDAMKETDIKYSDNPRLDKTFFAEAVRWPGRKQQITLRLDPDVLRFFRRQGRGYQTNINAVLRRFMQIQSRRAS